MFLVPPKIFLISGLSYNVLVPTTTYSLVMYLLKVLIEHITESVSVLQKKTYNRDNSAILKRPKVGGKIDVCLSKKKDVCLTLLSVLGSKRCVPFKYSVGFVIT